MLQNNTMIAETKSKSWVLPFILVTSLFFFWGFIHNINPILIAHLKKAFRLTVFKSSLVDVSVYIAYFTMALPAGFIIRKYSYKTGILSGLIMFALGCLLFIPAANTHNYTFFLTAFFIIACGLTFLETSANPYATVLGPQESATFRINLAQSFNGLAATVAPLVGSKLILSGKEYSDIELDAMPPAQLQAYLASEAASVKQPYLILGLILLAVAVLFVFIKLPEIKEDKSEDGKKSGILSVFKHGHLKWSVIAQFFYVGAQTCVLSFFILIAKHAANLNETAASHYLVAYGLAFLIGRFSGTAIMKFVEPKKLLAIYAAINILLSLVAVFGSGMVVIYALIGIAFFMSIMFPTIFSLGIFNLGNDTKIASSLIIMSIVGGAIIPPVLGVISDVSGSIQVGYIVTTICFGVIFYYATKGYKVSEKYLKA
ncbi:L-fucose:H+ symporter permease [Polluticaenibacter yanchengensis]|uniref:L-fucose:H+ symporter permease n=1 Tax=Polluticaenibacter yanchengensis TaxID=3014562 RepID=A0ABT4UFF8_9BACT|nr:L-fucose:H+ symporter permease [Chitinophagaceae bacterium LY-5]